MNMQESAGLHARITELTNRIAVLETMVAEMRALISGATPVTSQAVSGDRSLKNARG